LEEIQQYHKDKVQRTKKLMSIKVGECNISNLKLIYKILKKIKVGEVIKIILSLFALIGILIYNIYFRKITHYCQ